MDNIYLRIAQETLHTHQPITRVHYQPASNCLLVLHPPLLSRYTYHPNNYQLTHSLTLGPYQELEQPILVLQDMVEHEHTLAVTSDGTIFTIDKQGQIDIKAQNEDGITGASVSPTQEYIYLVTNNKSLIQLNNEYDLVNQIPLDKEEQVVASQPQFSWRTDGNFFILNYLTVNGHKAVTKDVMMTTFASPSKSDPEEDGLVKSVSQKGRHQMGPLVTWQPSASIIAGTDRITVQNSTICRVIFWQKNGLRHLEFNLPSDVTEVIELFWSTDSSILYVRVKRGQSQQICLYFRSNYHWYLKQVVPLNGQEQCLPLSSHIHKNQLLIVNPNSFEILQFQTGLPQKEWKSHEYECEFNNQFCYFVDGPVVNITDLSKCLMPPPMSMFQHNFQFDVIAISKKRHNLLVATKHKIFLYDLVKKTVVDQCQLGGLKGKRLPAFTLLENDSILFSVGSKQYERIEGVLQLKGHYQPKAETYSYSWGGLDHTIDVRYINDSLSINGNLISAECSSLTFHHHFLLFTLTSSNMYDKLYTLHLPLSQWITQPDTNIRNKLNQLQTKQLLNHRLIERGARIVSVTRGRVTFQLPRGNFEGIQPKVIMISQVQQHLQKQQYLPAFELIRTHKLDFNLMHDINPQQFNTQISSLLTQIKRVDYINLLVAQTTDTLSSELQYILTPKEYQNRVKQFQISGKGKKVNKVCNLVSSTLRSINKQEYILSIFTSQIKEGKLDGVLFQIKEMKSQEVEVVAPPHILNNKQKSKKRLTPQQILEFVCWLVDANAIYEAALLTYDLQLAAMAARCTQKDPKEYIPYLQTLKQIQNPVDFRTTICLDLKKYHTAIKQLSQGSVQQRQQSLALIKQHKLYKHGLIIYRGREELRQVKQYIVDQLLITGQVNEAYRVAQSIGWHQKAINIAVGSMDAKKIRESLEIIYPTKAEQQAKALQIIEEIKDQVKSRVELARLYAYTQQYEEAVSIYLRHNQYRKAYKYLGRVSPAFRQKQMKQGYQLCFSIRRNQILKDKKELLQKVSRLGKIHRERDQGGFQATFNPKEQEDMYSEVSVSSKAASSYTMSTTTGMRRKKDKKQRSILTRNIKEGSPIEEEYLLAYIKMLQDKVQDNVKQSKLLIQHLIYMNLMQQGEQLRDETRDYISQFVTHTVRSYAHVKFQQEHPQTIELYPQPHRLSSISIDSFNYLF